MNPRLGCFSWLLLVALCSWPLHAIGFSDNVSIISGVVLSSVILVVVGGWHSQRRIRETEEAIRRSREP